MFFAWFWNCFETPFEKIYLGCHEKYLILKTKIRNFCKFLRHIAVILHNFRVFVCCNTIFVFFAVVTQFSVILLVFFVSKYTKV